MKVLRKYSLIVVLLFSLFILAFSEDRRTNKSTLIIMTLNAEFLWDGVEPEEGQVNFAWKYSQTEAEEGEIIIPIID